MYLSFFGLNEKPFAITPDPRYLYLSERHAEALAHLLYGINEAGGFVQLTGEVGTGKTTTIRSLLGQTPKNAEVALILNPRMTPTEFLLTICEELGIGVPDSAEHSLKDLVDILNDYLLRAHAGGRRIVLVVDEAQNLSPEVLEQVRLLTNLETNTQKLLQIILIGQPELRALLERNDLRQLAQRITGRYHLDPLSAVETSAYVRHRLRVAGATTDIFTPPALSEIYRLSGGVPRVINVIADRALLGAYTQDRHRVGSSLVRHAAAEVFGRKFAPAWLPWAGAAGAGLAVVATVFLAWELFPGSRPAVAGDKNIETAPPAVAITESSAKAGTGDRVAGPASEASSGLRVASLTEPAAEPLSELLKTYASETVPDGAFGKLFGMWGAKYEADSDDPCTQASRQGLECLVQRGSFGQLRQYNRPAILMLNDESGIAHQVVLTNLADESAKVDLGGKRRVVRISDLARLWFGDFIMLWRPGTPHVKPLSVGMRGAEVRWLRQSLQRVTGAPPDFAASDVFDAQLSELVKDFQKRNQLTVDGIAGVQTQIVLASAVATPDSPVLRSEPAHGGG
ncbi:MAG TPA: AAA family ATPase [Steroidobacteraceae bacterium]|nr:AAA family ATPase [Steroidobacteraceae bacterium]